MKKLKLQELAADLKADIDKLEAGALNANQLEKLVGDARALHERLVIMHYLAQERLVKGKDTTEREQRVNFRLNAIHPGQTSLIDAIEELSSAPETPSRSKSTKKSKKKEVEEEAPREKKVQEETPEAEESAQMSIRIGLGGTPTDDPEEEPQTEEETTAEEASSTEEAQDTPEAETPIAPEPTAAPAEAPKAEAPKPAGTEKASLADKLRRTPVADLRKAISLNQKFQFIRELFNGESSRYDEVIDRINGADDLPEAVQTLEKHVPEIRVKAEDDPVAATLLDLVERRFL
jgi:hypothetical protein